MESDWSVDCQLSRRMFCESLLVCLMILPLIESRRSLRDYLIVNNQLSNIRRNELFSVYDQRERDLFCRFQSLDSSPNRLNTLISYPSQQIIGSIQNIYSPFSKTSFCIDVVLTSLSCRVVYQSSLRVFDDEFDQWFPGQISQRFRLDDLVFRIEYQNKFYLMEKKFRSPLIDIRDESRSNLLLSRFFPKASQPSKYHLQIYTNDLPDPLYILAFSLLNSGKKMWRFRRRTARVKTKIYSK